MGARRTPAVGLPATAAVLALGTYAGGWRIIRTLGRRVIHLGPPQGFAAETTAQRGALHRRAGARLADLDHAHDHLGDHGRRRDQAAPAVRWGVAGNIVIAWVLTFPAAAAVAIVATYATRWMF